MLGSIATHLAKARARVRRATPSLGALASSLAILSATSPCRAQIIRKDFDFDDDLNRILIEKGPVGATVTIQWTNDKGKVIDVALDPVQGTPTKIPASGQLKFSVPINDGSLVDPVSVDDALQTTKLPDPGSNVLHIEAFQLAPPELIVTRFTTAAAQLVGPGGTLRIPDVFADTNGNGVLDDNDLVYSSVNLFPYFAGGGGSFHLGDTVSIVDGVSSQLPGMVFGTQPITLDPASPDGFDNPAPLTATGSILSEHDVVPEPSSLTLAGIGALALLGYARHRPGSPGRTVGGAYVSGSPRCPEAAG